MDARSLMRGDAFIHFVCGSRRVNIRLGVLLLIPKSPQMHDMDAHLTYREKAWRQLHKNVVGCIEKVLEAIPHKTAAFRPPTAHHKNYPS